MLFWMRISSSRLMTSASTLMPFVLTFLHQQRIVDQVAQKVLFSVRHLCVDLIRRALGAILLRFLPQLAARVFQVSARDRVIIDARDHLFDDHRLALRQAGKRRHGSHHARHKEEFLQHGPALLLRHSSSPFPAEAIRFGWPRRWSCRCVPAPPSERRWGPAWCLFAFAPERPAFQDAPALWGGTL